MPIIKSAIKAMRQNRTHRVRNSEFRNRMKSLMRLILGYIQKGEMEKAKKLLPDVIKSIDMAAKKGIIHKNNAANKKSRVQRALSAGPRKKEEKAVKIAKEEKVKETPKKEVKAEKKAAKKSAKKEKEA